MDLNLIAEHTGSTPRLAKAKRVRVKRRKHRDKRSYFRGLNLAKHRPLTFGEYPLGNVTLDRLAELQLGAWVTQRATGIHRTQIARLVRTGVFEREGDRRSQKFGGQPIYRYRLTEFGERFRRLGLMMR